MNGKDIALIKALSGGSSGGGLPSGGTPYQQLVTDGDGNAKWEDRLAYVATEEQVIFSQENIEFTDKEAEVDPAPYQLIIGNKYTVIFDGVAYENLTAFDEEGCATIGSPYGSISDDLPFSIATFEGPESAILAFSISSDASMHSVTISGPAEVPHKIPKKYLYNTGLDIVLTADSDGTVSGNVTYEQVLYAFNNKEPIRFFIYLPNGICFELICARIEKSKMSASFSFYLVLFNTNTAKTAINVYSFNNANKWSISSNTTIVEDAT